MLVTHEAETASILPAPREPCWKQSPKPRLVFAGHLRVLQLAPNALRHLKALWTFAGQRAALLL